MELLIARNPDPDSKLPYLLRIPLAGVPLLRVREMWPRTSAVYCHPVPDSEWPAEPDIVERIELRACDKRGAAIDIVATRSRENRSQIVFTTARGRDVVFWQSPRTRVQSRPKTSPSRSKAQGISELEIVVDTHERYAYTFTAQRARTVTRTLPCGDYAVTHDGKIVAAVERKSITDLTSSMASGRCGTHCPTSRPSPAPPWWSRTSTRPRCPRATSAPRTRRTVSPNCRCGTRTCRSCSRRLENWPRSGPFAIWPQRWCGWPAIPTASAGGIAVSAAPASSGPTPAAIRTWARGIGLEVNDRGAIPNSIRQQYNDAHPAGSTSAE